MIAKLSASVKDSFTNPVHCLVILPTSVIPSFASSWKSRWIAWQFIHTISAQIGQSEFKSYRELNIRATTRTDWPTNFENSITIFVQDVQYDSTETLHLSSVTNHLAWKTSFLALEHRRHWLAILGPWEVGDGLGRRGMSDLGAKWYGRYYRDLF